MKLMREQGGKFLAPGAVGSHIEWYVNVDSEINKAGKLRSVSLSGSANLGDCSRVINWGFSEHIYQPDEIPETYKGDLVKIETAIAELTRLHKALLKGYKIVEQKAKLLEKRGED